MEPRSSASPRTLLKNPLNQQLRGGRWGWEAIQVLQVTMVHTGVGESVGGVGTLSRHGKSNSSRSLSGFHEARQDLRDITPARITAPVLSSTHLITPHTPLPSPTHTLPTRNLGPRQDNTEARNFSRGQEAGTEASPREAA